MNKPLIITCPVVGAELDRGKYPYLPLTPNEISRAARDAVKAGASIIHLHVRDKDGQPTQRIDIFEEVTEKIRKKCDCIIQYSTGGAVGTSLKDRCAPLVLLPDMASLNMGTMNFGSEIFENTEETICTIAKAIMELGIIPELEIFDCGMLDTAFRLAKKGVVPEKFQIGFGFGAGGGMGGSVDNLIFLKNKLHPDQIWTASGIGRHHLPISACAIAIGGHVRVGIEDNIYYRHGELAKSNAQLVKRIVKISKELQRPIATVEQAREMIGIIKRPRP